MQNWVEGRGCYWVSVGDSSRSLPLSGTLAVRGAHCASHCLCRAHRKRS